MKRLSIIILLNLLILFQLKAQINIELLLPDNVNTKDDTILLCQESYIFTANITYENGDVFNDTTTFFSWDFGDNTYDEAIFLKQASHSYSGGAFYLSLYVRDENGVEATRTYPVFVSMEPYFYDTKADSEEYCKWDKIKLTGNIIPHPFEYKPDSSKTYNDGKLISDDAQLTSTVNFRLYDDGQTLENIDSLHSIRIDMEHSSSSDLEIILTCPNNTEIVLKNAGGENAVFGEPVISDEEFWDRGESYNYYWVNAPAYGSMDNNSMVLYHDYTDVNGNNYTHQAYYPSGTYASYESLKTLEGCPLNGEWKLSFIDHASQNNGFLFSWGLVFTDEIEAGLWEFENMYDFRNTTWLDNETNKIRSVNLDGTALAQRLEGEHEPLEYADHNFIFQIQDDYGCYYDTTLTIKVVKPEIIADPEEGEVPVEVQLKTEANWIESYMWDFGDRTNSIEPDPVHEYTEGGTTEEPKFYDIILIATSENGCQDSDTLSFKAREPDSNFTVPNIFTPNAASNNIFKVIPGGSDDIDPKDRLRGPDDQILRFEKFDMRIYSRWGHLLYKTSNWEEGWDGKIGGLRQAEEAVYFYVIKAEGKDKKKHNKRGHLYLYRGGN